MSKKINNKISLIAYLIANGISIPHYCYHNDLSIAGNCRVCLVELKNSPKPVVSCATNAKIELKFIIQKRMLHTNLTYTEIYNKLNINMKKNGLIIKNSAQIRCMVTDSKFTGIDPKKVEKVERNEEATITYGEPLEIEIQNNDIKKLINFGQLKESLSNTIDAAGINDLLSDCPDFKELVEKFDNKTFRGLMGITGGASAAAECPYQISRLIERLRIDRFQSVLGTQRALGDGKQINKWIPDPNKFLGEIDPRFKFLSNEQIIKALSETPFGKAPNLLIEESPIVKVLAAQTSVTRTLAVTGMSIAFVKVIVTGEIFTGKLKQLPIPPESLVETNKSQMPPVMGKLGNDPLNIRILSEINKEPIIPAENYDFEFDSENSGSSKDGDHSSISEIKFISEVDSNLVSSSSLYSSLESQVPVEEVQYSDSLVQSASHDSSSVGSHSPGKKSKKSDDDN